MTTEDDEDAIITAVANRTPVREIARAYNLSAKEVDAIIDRRAAEMFDGEKQRRKMLIEDARLEALGELHYQRGKEGDVASGALYVKISERRSVMRGLSVPQSHIVQLMTAADLPQRETSTQHIRNVLDNVLRITKRERELLDRHELEGDNDPATIAEINELRAARGKPPLPASLDGR
jgi:hypothetical protein